MRRYMPGTPWQCQHFPPNGRTVLTGASVWASLHFCITVCHLTAPMLRRGVRAGRRSSPAKRVYGLKPVSRVQIPPSPPHTQLKRRVTVKGNSPFLRSGRGKIRGVAEWRTYRHTYFWGIWLENLKDSGAAKSAEQGRIVDQIFLRSVDRRTKTLIQPIDDIYWGLLQVR